MSGSSRADRVRLAKQTISKVIPSLLMSNPAAASGVSCSRLIRPLDELQLASVPSLPPKITVVECDTFDAAQKYLNESPDHNVTILSMASPLRPGGGVLTGASSQEESLCLRSTLYASLMDEYYRLPEDAVIYSPDVLVFRDSEYANLKKGERFYVDVISCAALRIPDIKEGGAAYSQEKDREIMMNKIRGIIRAAVRGKEKLENKNRQGVLILGAFGCGAYGNPPEEVAEMFKKVILGTKRRSGEPCGEITEILFAIKPMGQQGLKNLDIFRNIFAEQENHTFQ